MPLRDFADRFPLLTTRLLQARQQGRQSHAYLIVGDDLARLRRFALALVQAAACPQPTATGDACGSCATCERVAAGKLPSMQMLQPVSKSRQIVVDDIREMEHHLYLRSEGAIKVGLILEADCLNEQAQNAFLKTLEEPAENTLLLLVTVSPNNLLATIRSRCQLLSLFDNRQAYPAELVARLVPALAPMARGAGALVAIPAADALITLLADEKATAKEESAALAKEAKSAAAELPPAARKKVEERSEALETALYRGRRDMLLSALHTWFAQEYLRASGVARQSLPNPEFYTSPPPAQPSPTNAARSLRLAEEFLWHLELNVDEPLCVQDFCQQVCAKS